MSLTPFLAAAVALTVLWLAWATFQASRRRKVTRAAFFSAVEPLFDRVVTRLEPTGFPRLTAHLGPHAFDLQATPDSLTFRKLPALWVMLTLPEPGLAKATLDIMARPAGNEPFSHFARLPHSLPCPTSLPEGTGLRSDDATQIPTEARMAPYLGLFADPKVKELVISPKGLRLVILADEAERGRYLIFRDGEVGQVPLHPARLTPLIDTLLSLRQSLMEAK